MSQTRLHFSIVLARETVCPICVNRLVDRAIVFVEGHAFCQPCSELTDQYQRRYAGLVVSKHAVHQDHENWSTCLGLTFYTPQPFMTRASYMVVDPDVYTAPAAPEQRQ